MQNQNLQDQINAAWENMKNVTVSLEEEEKEEEEARKRGEVERIKKENDSKPFLNSEIILDDTRPELQLLQYIKNDLNYKIPEILDGTKGNDPNIWVLLDAIKRGELSKIANICKENAKNVDLFNSFKGTMDPLTFAIKLGQFEVVLMLIAAGADPNRERSYRQYMYLDGVKKFHDTKTAIPQNYLDIKRYFGFDDYDENSRKMDEKYKKINRLMSEKRMQALKVYDDLIEKQEDAKKNGSTSSMGGNIKSIKLRRKANRKKRRTYRK
jgi:hypothetical protein